MLQEVIQWQLLACLKPPPCWTAPAQQVPWNFPPSSLTARVLHSSPMASSSHSLLEKLLTNSTCGTFASSLSSAASWLIMSHSCCYHRFAHKQCVPPNHCFVFYMDKNYPCSYWKSIQTRTWVSSWQVNPSLRNYFYYFIVEGKTCFFFSTKHILEIILTTFLPLNCFFFPSC